MGSVSSVKRQDTRAREKLLGASGKGQQAKETGKIARDVEDVKRGGPASCMQGRQGRGVWGG